MIQSKQRMLLLAAAGLAAGLATVNIDRLLPSAGMYTPGLLFGLAIAVVLVFRDGVRSIFYLPAFVGACCAAFPISFFVAMCVDLPIHPGAGAGRLDVPLPTVFIAGSAGAFVVLFSAFVLFEQDDIASGGARRLLGWSTVGGGLAVIGWMTRRQGGPDLTPALFVLWQTGVAACIAKVVRVENNGAGIVAERSSRPMATKVARLLLSGAILAFFGWQLSSYFWGEHERALRDAERQRLIATAPAIEGLPAIEAIPAEQALIDEDIGEFIARTPSRANIPIIPGSSLFPADAPHARYTLVYVRETSSHDYQIVTVTVDQYPNSAWAQYRMRYLYNTAVSRGHFDALARFGNRIYRDSWQTNGSRGNLLDHWSSGGVVVAISYSIGVVRQVEEAFLKRYLEKYPSSL